MFFQQTGLKGQNENATSNIDAYLRNIVNDKSMIVTGLLLNTSNQLGMKQRIERFFADELGVKTKIVKTTRLSETEFVTDVNHFEDKVRIMNTGSRLRSLGDDNVYIYSGGTKRERRVDEAISMKAREELAKGNDVRVGYMKIFVNGAEWEWNEEEKRIVKVTTSSHRNKCNTSTCLHFQRSSGLRENEIVISGLHTTPYDSDEVLTNKVQTFLQRDVQLHVKVLRARRFRQDLCIAETATTEDKIKILKNVYRLENKGVRVYNSTAQIPTRNGSKEVGHFERVPVINSEESSGMLMWIEAVGFMIICISHQNAFLDSFHRYSKI